MNCRELEQLLATGQDAVASSAGATVEHLLDCPKCRSLSLTGALIGEAPSPGPRSSSGPCLEPEQLSLLVAGSLPGAPRREALRHIDACGRCFEEVVSLIRDAEHWDGLEPVAPPPALEREAIALAAGRVAKGRRLLHWAAAAGILIAVVGAGMLLLDRPRPFSRGPAPVFRGDAGDVPVPIEPQGEISTAGSLRFRWQPTVESAPDTARGSRFRLIVIDLERGTTVLEKRTREPSYTLTAADADLIRPGIRYHWIVESLGGQDAAPSAALVFWLAR